MHCTADDTWRIEFSYLFFRLPTDSIAGIPTHPNPTNNPTPPPPPPPKTLKHRGLTPPPPPSYTSHILPSHLPHTSLSIDGHPTPQQSPCPHTSMHGMCPYRSKKPAEASHKDSARPTSAGLVARQNPRMSIVMGGKRPPIPDPSPASKPRALLPTLDAAKDRALEPAAAPAISTSAVSKSPAPATAEAPARTKTLEMPLTFLDRVKDFFNGDIYRPI